MGHSLRHGVYHMLCRIHGVGMACHCAESEPIGGMMDSAERKCLHCSNPADGVDGKCMFHSQDDLGGI